MATKTIIQTYTVDDLDGTEGAETLTFAVRGVSYEIDLNAEHAAELDALLAPYVTAGRRIGSKRASLPRPSQARVSGRKTAGQGLGREQAKQARVWARKHGYQVADRGRLDAAVIEAFQNSTDAPAARVAAEPTPQGQVPTQASGDDRPSPMSVAEAVARRNRGRIYPAGIREWAREEGHKVGNGAIDAEIVEQFYAAHPEVERV